MKGWRRHIFLSVSLVFISAFVLSGFCLAAWKAKGPTGTEINWVKVDDADKSTLYVGTNGGVYKSTDLGLTWKYKGLRFRRIARVGQCSGCNLPLVASGRNTVYKSADGGDSWTVLTTTPAGINTFKNTCNPPDNCISYKGTDDGVWVSGVGQRLVGEIIEALAIDSAYNAYVGTDNGEIYKTTDDGDNWTVQYAAGGMIFDLCIDSSDRIFAGTSPDGVQMSEDGGGAWTARNNGLPDPGGSGGYAVDTLKKIGSVLYAAVITSIEPLSTTVYKSSDNGATWSATNSAISGEYGINRMAANADGKLFVGTSRGLFRSDDGGAGWMDLTAGISAVGFWNSFVENSSGRLFVGSEGSGIYASGNGGETWSRIGTGDPNRPEALLVDSSDNVYCTDNSIGGVYKSSDNGTTWSQSSTGLPVDMVVGSETGYAQIFSLGMDGNGRLYTGLEAGKVYFSDDGGSNWSAAAVLPGVTSKVQALLGGSGATVYAGTGYSHSGVGGNGIFMSTDGGATWTAKNNGLPTSPNVPKNGLMLDSGTGDLYAALWNNGGLYKSTNGGDSWSSIFDPSGCGVTAVTMDRLNNLYALSCNDTVYKSSNGGVNWSDFSAGLIRPLGDVEGISVQGVFADSRNNLILATMSSGMYRYSSFPWMMFISASINHE